MHKKKKNNNNPTFRMYFEFVAECLTQLANVYSLNWFYTQPWKNLVIEVSI